MNTTKIQDEKPIYLSRNNYCKIFAQMIYELDPFPSSTKVETKDGAYCSQVNITSRYKNTHLSLNVMNDGTIYNCLGKKDELTSMVFEKFSSKYKIIPDEDCIVDIKNEYEFIEKSELNILNKNISKWENKFSILIIIYTIIIAAIVIYNVSYHG